MCLCQNSKNFTQLPLHVMSTRSECAQLCSGQGLPWKQRAEGLLLTSCPPFELHMQVKQPSSGWMLIQLSQRPTGLLVIISEACGRDTRVAPRALWLIIVIMSTFCLSRAAIWPLLFWMLLDSLCQAVQFCSSTSQCRVRQTATTEQPKEVNGTFIPEFLPQGLYILWALRRNTVRLWALDFIFFSPEF